MACASHIMVQKQTESQPQPRVRMVKRITYKRNRRMLRLVGSMSVLFLLGVLLVFVSAQVAVFGYRVVELKQSIVDIEKENKRLELSIAQLSSLDRIEQVAATSLGMCKPDDTQLVAMNGEIQPVAVVKDSGAARETTGTEQPKPLEKVYQVLAELASSTKTIGMN